MADLVALAAGLASFPVALALGSLALNTLLQAMSEQRPQDHGSRQPRR